MRLNYLAAIVAMSMVVASYGSEQKKKSDSKENVPAESSAEQSVAPDAEVVEETTKTFELGNKDLVMPMNVKKGVTTHYLTDY